MGARRSGPPILRWHGILADRTRDTRLRILGFLAVFAVAMTFTQVGLLHVSVGPNQDAYVVLLLVPMTLTAMLLGTFWSFAMGLFVAGVTALHAQVQPLDYYEAVAITPLSAVVLFGLSGLLLGLLFALAIRRNPVGWKRILRMAVPCLVVSALFSFAFFFSAAYHIAMRLILESGVGSLDEGASRLLLAVMRMGEAYLQFAADFVLMVASCRVCDWLVARFGVSANLRRLKDIFSSWLLLVVSFGFMIIVTVSFAVVTDQELSSAQTTMTGELDYIEHQLDIQEERVSLFDETSDIEDMIDNGDLAERFANAFAMDSLVEGYEVANDGMVLVLLDMDDSQYIVVSNSDRYEVGSKVSDAFDEDAVDAIEASAEDGRIGRIVLDSFDDRKADISVVADMGYTMSRKTDECLITIIVPAAKLFVDRDSTVLWITVASFVLLAFVFVLVRRLLSHLVIKPVSHTNEELDAICQGDLDAEVKAQGSLELSDLSQGINTTVDTLKGWIDVAERRLDQELTTAKAIQSSALPSTFPPFPDVHEFDIFASMNAAKMVGGDFYDFFLINKDTLGFLIADVSGKGIPGALFMMAAKAELDNYMQTGMDLAEAIKTANYRLCSGNEAGMFVTVWAATLNYRTGLLTYVNAGHNPPLLRHDGVWTWLKHRGGLFMGTFEKAKYKSAQIMLSPGDQLLLYTDGVNEAFNVDEEEYGNDRLEAFLAEHADLHPHELVDGLRASVAEWAEGAEQSDDITIMSLEYGKAPEASKSLEVPATIGHLDEVLDFVNLELVQRLCPFGAQRKVDIALEELFVNVCRYAYRDGEDVGTCRVAYVYTTNPNTITVSLSDKGVPFDPLSQESVNPLDAVENGGLGILLVRNSVDDIAYVRDGDSNVIAFTKSW